MHGTRGRIDFAYESDRVASVTRAGTSSTTYDRSGLLENLVDHVSSGAPLISPIERTGAFMAVLEAVRASPLPRPIDPRGVHWHGDGSNARPAVIDVDRNCGLVAETGRGFTALGAPWTHSHTVLLPAPD